MSSTYSRNFHTIFNIKKHYGVSRAKFTRNALLKSDRVSYLHDKHIPDLRLFLVTQNFEIN